MDARPAIVRALSPSAGSTPVPDNRLTVERRLTTLETNYTWIRWMLGAMLTLEAVSLFGVRVFDFVTIVPHP